jgi:hypothetical protein
MSMKKSLCSWFMLGIHEVQLIIEVINWKNTTSPEVQLTIEVENGRRQLKPVKSEIQSQFKLTA